MRAILIGLAAAALAAAQTQRVFQLTQDETPQQMQEIATLMRSTGDLQQIFADVGQRTVTVTDTSAQLDLAGWYIKQLDRSTPPPSPQDYRPAGAANDVVRLFFLSHVSTLQQLQEVATNVRAIVDMRRLFIYNTLHAMAVRGTNSQVTMAAWLVNQLDQPVGVVSPAPNQYQLATDDIAQVFNTTNPQNPQQLQEMVTTMRSIGDIQRIFIYNARKTIVARSTPDRIALAAWLVKQLDRPASTPSATGEYELPNIPDNQVRVFYTAHIQSPADLQKVATQVRVTARTPRLFVYNPLGAVALRGTPGQVATAEKLLEEMRTSQ